MIHAPSNTKTKNMVKSRQSGRHISMREEIKNLFDFKDLFLIFVWREFNIRYRQSILGILWAAIQPISMMLLFTFVFTKIMPVHISQYPYPVFLYSALLPWSFFAASLNYAIPSLVTNYTLITKIYFPREILPLSGIAIAVVDFCIAALFLILLMIYYKTPFTLTTLWVIPLFFILFLFTIAVCLFLSALNVYYRDVNLAIGFVIQLWFFGTPIFYSIDRVPWHLKLLLFLNPLVFIIENMRRCLLERRSPILWQYIIMLIFVCIISSLSYRFFKSTEKKFADVI